MKFYVIMVYFDFSLLLLKWDYSEAFLLNMRKNENYVVENMDIIVFFCKFTAINNLCKVKMILFAKRIDMKDNTTNYN